MHFLLFPQCFKSSHSQVVPFDQYSICLLHNYAFSLDPVQIFVFWYRAEPSFEHFTKLEGCPGTTFRAHVTLTFYLPE